MRYNPGVKRIVHRTDTHVLTDGETAYVGTLEGSRLARFVGRLLGVHVRVEEKPYAEIVRQPPAFGHRGWSVTEGRR